MTNQMELLNKVLYPVALEKVDSKSGSKNIIIRTDTAEVLSEVSDRYTLVSNRDLLMPFIEHFGEARLASCVVKKKSTVIEIETGRTFEMGTKGRSDIIKERLVIQNSYDRTRSYSFQWGAFRIVCSNGLYVGTMAMQFRKIHTGEIPAQEMIQTVIRDYKKNKFDLWRQMTKVPLTVKQRLQSLNKLEVLEIADNDKDPNSAYRNFALNEKIRAKAAEYISLPESIDNSPSLWGGYNAVNRAISNELRGSYMFHKRLVANRMAEQYFAKKFNLN